MVARLTKNLNAERRRAPPVGALNEDLNALWVADASDVRIAPSAGAESGGNELDRLYAALQAVTPQAHPRTARLLSSSTRKVAQKVIEEAGEVALATVKHNSRGIVRESADLLYHLAVLCGAPESIPPRSGAKCAAAPTASASLKSCRSRRRKARVSPQRPKTNGQGISPAVRSRLIRRGRSGRGSSPCSRPPQSLSQTSLSSPHTHRLRQAPAVASANRRSGRHACRSI
jgi:phosphoribosyl-ATP pyrophosphohydrolase